MSTEGTIKVTLAELGKSPITLELPVGSTLHDAFELIGKTLGEGFKVYVDNDEADEDTPLSDDSTVAVAPPVKGGC